MGAELSISLNFFTSTKGHFGCRTIWKETLNNLRVVLDLYPLLYKVAHIKVSPGDELYAEEMESQLWNEFGFQHVIKTVGEWSHTKGTSHTEYLKDIETMFSFLRENSKAEIGLWMEDDWIFSQDKLLSTIYTCLSSLTSNPAALAVRPTRTDDTDIITRTHAKFLKENDVGLKIYGQNREFSFNPTFIRNPDQYFISKIAKGGNLHPHCEMAYTLASNYFSETDTPFLFVDSKIVTHIGTPEMAQECIKKYGK